MPWKRRRQQERISPDFNKGNIKARSRMIAQYVLAGARSDPLVVGRTMQRKILQVSSQNSRW